MGRQLRVLLVVGAVLVAAVGAALWLAFGDVARDPAVDEARVSAPRDGRAATAAANAAAAKRLGAPAKLSGEVRRAGDGKPAVGQRVVLVGARGKSLEVQTDARGAFEFADVPHGGPYDVVVNAPDCAEVKVPGIELKRGETKDVGTLWLAPATPVVVEVRTFAGDPIPAATVDAFLVGANAPAFESPAPPTPVSSATTDAEGVARFPRLAVGTWTFVAGKSGFARRGSPEEQIEVGEPERRIRLVLEHGYRIDGRVLTRAGAPIPGASVVALRRTLTADATTAPLCCRGRADAEGRYVLDSLPGADVCIWAARPDGRLGLVAAVRPAGVPHFDLVLPDPSYVTGHVTDHKTGAPIAGAVVTVAFQILGGLSLGCEATTDDAGAYRIALPMVGSLNEIAAAKEGYVRGTDDAIANTSIQVTEGATIVRDLPLDRGASLTGVVHAAGGPVGGAGVTAYQRTFSASVATDREGRYRFDALPSGPTLVCVAKHGFAQPEFPSDDPQGAVARGSAPAKYVVEIPTAGAASLDVAIESGKLVLHGIVKGEGGAPIEGAHVGPQGAASWTPTTTGKDGTFQVDGVAAGETVALWVRKEGYAAYAATTGLPDGDTPFECELTPIRRVTGRVKTSNGAPLADAYVQIAAPSQQNRVDEEWSWLSAPRLPVHADGSFEVEEETGAEQIVVRASATGFAPSVSAPVAAAADAPPRVELTLSPARSLAGVVRTKAGAAVAGAWVAVFPRSGPVDNSDECNGAWGPAVAAVADASGRFELRDLAPGWWGVRAGNDATTRIRVIVEVPHDGDVVVEVDPTLSIDGTVVLADGAPIAGAAVTAGGDDGSANAVSDASGAFHLAGLAPGAYSVAVAPSPTCRVNFVAATKSEVPAGTAGLRIEAGKGLEIAGVLVDSDGRPVRGAGVAFRREDGDGDVEVPQAYTDVDGRFAVVGLTPGHATLTIHVSDPTGDVGAIYGGIDIGGRDLRLVLPKTATVEGIVVDESGKPVAQVNLRAVPDAAESAGGRDTQSPETPTDEDGRFSFRALASTAYRIQIEDSSDLALIDVPPIRPGGAPHRLVAKSGASIAGVLVDKEGKPLAGVNVAASAADFNRTASSNDDGTFEIKGLLPQATYSVTTSGDVVIPPTPQDVVAGRRDVRIVASRALEISGRLVDRDGNPIGQSWLSAVSTDGDAKTRNARTDDRGRFMIRGVPPGELTIMAMPPDAAAWVSCGTARAGDHDVTLRADVSTK